MALNEGREITLAMAEMFNNELREMELDGAAIELSAFTTFGTAASATDWWLGSELDSPRRMPRDDFIAHMIDDHARLINGTCELLGIKIDPDLPLHEGVRRRETVA